MSLTSDSPSPSDPCAGCASRRGFLRDGAAFAAALIGLSALQPYAVLHALESPPPSGVSGAHRTVKYAIPTADGIAIDATNEIILCRSGADVFAFALSCPHQNTPLRAMPKNAGFQCPRHKSKYKINGTFISGRATRNMDRLQIVRDGNTIAVDPSIAFESDTEPAKWQAARSDGRPLFRRMLMHADAARTIGSFTYPEIHARPVTVIIRCIVAGRVSHNPSPCHDMGALAGVGVHG